MIENGTLWAAIPHSFNDPFDCNASIFSGIAGNALDNFEKQNKAASWIITLKKSVDYGFPFFGMSMFKRKELLKRVEQSKSLDYVLGLFKKIEDRAPVKIKRVRSTDVIRAIEKKLSEIGVVSLSETDKNMLMWSHYSDNHRGYCLGYEINDAVYCKPVQYTKKFPELDMDSVKAQFSYALTTSRNDATTTISVGIDDKNLKTVIYTKSDEWAYEREWRYVTQAGGKEIPYPGLLREVIFGLRCDIEYRTKIIKAVRKNTPNVTFKKIETRRNSFLLETESLKA
ncbi:MAG: DUF2971 domain-containing protein [Nitrospirae bacterium]|nr:DUF2971 domain-containing protein [Nitrospirota bacterium]